MTPLPLHRSRTGRQRIPGVLQAPPFGRRPAWIGTTFAGSIEEELLDAAPLSQPQEHRARSALDAIVTQRIGGEFWGPGLERKASPGGRLLRPRRPSSAMSMVRNALEETEAASAIVSMPDQPWARRFGTSLKRKGVHVHLGPLDPWSALDDVQRIDVDGEDPLAFLGLAIGKRVRCETACSLAGWGLTEDAPGLPFRGPRRFVQLAEAALISGVDYLDPFTRRAANCEDAIDVLAHWRRVFDRNRPIAVCVGISAWKRKAVGSMLRSGRGAPPFRRRAHAAADIAARDERSVAVWNSRAPAGLIATAAWRRTPLLHVEDGFLRSAGLGSNLTPPCSIVVDRRAPHYCGDQASDLEVLLAEGEFDPALLARAERLIKSITRLGLTKYNSGGAPFERSSNSRLVLVPGQVEDDLSVLMGGCGLRDNLELLARVRQAEPASILLFKPHPDVEAGHRAGAIPDSQALLHADQVVRGVSTAHLLDAVDAVHVLTSLTGFEALLRGREVVVHGQPFYAGWGLTRDLAPISRRTRRLTLAELAAGALILYPHYLDPVSGLPCPPEVLVARLACAEARPSPLSRLRQAQGRLRRLAAGWRREALP